MAAVADTTVKLITFVAAPAAALGLAALYVQFTRLGVPLSQITLQDAARAGLIPSLAFGVLGAFGVGASKHANRTVATVIIIAVGIVLIPGVVSDTYGDATKLITPRFSDVRTVSSFAIWVGAGILRLALSTLLMIILWALESWREGRNFVRDAKSIAADLKRLFVRIRHGWAADGPASAPAAADPAPEPEAAANVAATPVAEPAFSWREEFRQAFALTAIICLGVFLFAYNAALDLRYNPTVQGPWASYLAPYSPIQLAKYSAIFGVSIAAVSFWAFVMVWAPRNALLATTLPVANWLIAILVFCTFLYAYSVDIYPQAPEGLGGGQPEQLRLWFKADEVSPRMQQLMGPAACANQDKVVECRVRAVTTSASVIVIPAAGRPVVVGRTSVTGLMSADAPGDARPTAPRAASP